MKTRLLAFLLCFVLVLSACLMTACGGSKNDKVAEVTDEEARQTALSSFFKGVDAIRHGGIVFTGSVKGSVTETDETGAKKTNAIDLNLSLNYNDEQFVAVAEGTADGESGRGEIYFDGTLFGTLGKGEGKEAEFDVFFLDDVAGKLPVTLPTGEDADYTEILDKISALIDYDKVAENIAKATKDFIVIQTKGKTYVISVSSDKVFDAVLGILDTVKNSGNMKISELVDALCGAGTWAKIVETLDKYEGTTKLATLIPDLEALLTDAGIKVDALYAFVGEMMGLTAAPGSTVADQVKVMLGSLLNEMTINDAIAMLGDSIFGSMFDFGGDEGNYEVEPLEAAAPGAEEEDGDEYEETEEAMTYEDIVALIKQFAEMTVNDLGASLKMMDDEDPTQATFDIAEEIAPAIEYVTAFKAAIKFDLTVTCDSKLNPTAIELTATIDSTKLPEDMEADPANITLTISAEMKDAVTVTPSAEMAEKVAAAKANREPAPAGE